MPACLSPGRKSPEMHTLYAHFDIEQITIEQITILSVVKYTIYLNTEILNKCYSSALQWIYQPQKHRNRGITLRNRFRNNVFIKFSIYGGHLGGHLEF